MSNLSFHGTTSRDPIGQHFCGRRFMSSFAAEAALFGISHQVELEVIRLFVIIRRQRLRRHIQWLHQMRGHDYEKLRFILLK